MLLPLLFYLIIIGLTNIVVYQIAKKAINKIVELAVRKSFFTSSLWLILIFKFLITLIIDHQPGSVCGGLIFSNEQNLQLNFWLFNLTESDLVKQQRRKIQNHFNDMKLREGENTIEKIYEDGEVIV